MTKKINNGEFFTDPRLGYLAIASLLGDIEVDDPTSAVYIDLCCGDGGLVSHIVQEDVVDSSNIILSDVDEVFLDQAVQSIGGSEVNKLSSKPIDLLKTPAKDIAELLLNHELIKGVNIQHMVFVFNPPYAVVKDKSDVDYTLFEDVPSYGKLEKCVLCLHQLGKIIQHMKEANIGANYHAVLLTKDLFRCYDRKVNKGAQSAIYPHLRLMRLMLTPAKTFFKVSGNWPVSITTWTDLEVDGVERAGPPLGVFYDISKKDMVGLSGDEFIEFKNHEATRVKVPIFYVDPYLEGMREVVEQDDWPKGGARWTNMI